jgi:hypothetical protein
MMLIVVTATLPLKPTSTGLPLRHLRIGELSGSCRLTSRVALLGVSVVSRVLRHDLACPLDRDRRSRRARTSRPRTCLLRALGSHSSFVSLQSYAFRMSDSIRAAATAYAEVGAGTATRWWHRSWNESTRKSPPRSARMGQPELSAGLENRRNLLKGVGVAVSGPWVGQG